MAYHRDKCEVTFSTPFGGKQTQTFRDYASLAQWAQQRAEEQAQRFPSPTYESAAPVSGNAS